MGKPGPCAMFRDLPSSKILKQIARLNNIAGTPERAFKFDSSKISKVEMFLIHKNVHGPSVGLKKFWRQDLPTLKFHNDDIAFVMNRISASTKAEVAKCPSKIVVHKTDGGVIELDCADKHSTDILRQLAKLTGAKNVMAEDIPVIVAPPEYIQLHHPETK